jgi:Zinc-binding dehydrogenase
LGRHLLFVRSGRCSPACPAVRIRAWRPRSARGDCELGPSVLVSWLWMVSTPRRSSRQTRPAFAPVGVHLVSYISSAPTESMGQRRQRASQVLQWIEDATLDVLVDRTYPLQDGASAHRDLESRLRLKSGDADHTTGHPGDANVPGQPHPPDNGHAECTSKGASWAISMSALEHKICVLRIGPPQSRTCPMSTFSSSPPQCATRKAGGCLHLWSTPSVSLA